MEIGICGALTIMFIALKLLGLITWSWIWVLSPLWIGVLLGIGLMLMMIWAEYKIKDKYKW